MPESANELNFESSLAKWDENSDEGENSESGATRDSNTRSSKSGSFLIVAPGGGGVEASKKAKLKSDDVSKVSSGVVTFTSATPFARLRFCSILKTFILKFLLRLTKGGTNHV